MKNIFALLLLGFLAVAAVGCKNQVKDKNTQMLDSIIDVVDADLAAINAIDINKLGKMLSVYDKYFEFFSTQYQEIDSIAYFLTELDQMADCRKNMQKTHVGLLAWKEELEKSSTQLKALKHDYENDLITKEDFNIHINNEIAASFEINKEVQKRVGTTAKCMRMFKELTDKLDSTRVVYLKAHE